MSDPKKAKLGGKSFYFLAIDGTDAIDSAEFGKQIMSFGFRDLLGEFLKDNASSFAADEKNARLVDPNHDFMPIWKVVPKYGAGATALASKDGAAVVCPRGLNSVANDKFWQADRIANIDKAAEAVEGIILRPRIVKNESGKYALATGDAAHDLEKAKPAHILQISSHGWLGGFMGGNAMVESDGQYHPQVNWTIVGRLAKKGEKFEGPVWLIFAQCSTVATATWPSWVKVFAASDPPVRGVIAYEEVAPAATTAGIIYQDFFAKLRTGYTSGPKKGKPIGFLDAWKQVNESQSPPRHWAAIIHKDAVDDSLSTFDTLADIDVSDALNGAYLGWSHTHDKKLDAHPIEIETPPFKLALARINDASGAPHGTIFDEANLDQAELRPKKNPDGTVWKHHYLVWLEPPAGSGAKISGATIEWVHIRLSKPSFDSRRLFSAITVRDATADVVYDTYNLTLDGKTSKRGRWVIKNASSVKLLVDFDPKDDFKGASTMDDHYEGDDKLVGHHSYLWLRVGLELDDGTKVDPFDFTTRGLVFYGGY